MIQTEIARKANTGYQIWVLLENAKQTSYSAFTLSKVEKALGWKVGDIERILRDENFMPPIENEDPTDKVEELNQRVARLEREFSSVELALDRLREALTGRRQN